MFIAWFIYRVCIQWQEGADPGFIFTTSKPIFCEAKKCPCGCAAGRFSGICLRGVSRLAKTGMSNIFIVISLVQSLWIFIGRKHQPRPHSCFLPVNHLPPPTSYFASNLSGRYNIWCMAYARDEWPFLIRFEIGTLKLNCAKTFRIRTNKVRLFPYFDCASPFLSLATHEKETCLFSSNGTRDKMAIYSPNTGMTGPYWEGFSRSIRSHSMELEITGLHCGCNFAHVLHAHKYIHHSDDEHTVVCPLGIVCFAQCQGSSACLGCQNIQTWTDSQDIKR